MDKSPTTLSRTFLSDTAGEHLHRRFISLRSDDTVAEAIAHIQRQDVDQSIVYFYVLDDQRRLAGVVPVRRLLFANPAAKIADIMIKEVVSVPETISIADAGATLLEYKLLALPVVDADNRMLGVLDLSHFTEDALDTLSMVRRPQTDRFFQLLGLHISLNRHVSPWAQFRERFPWLLCNVASGLMCAVIASFYELLIQQIVLLAMFMTVVLALAESVSMQAMTIALQAMDVRHFSWGVVRRFLTKEMATGLLLGVGCGVLIGAVAFVWKGRFWPSVSICASVTLAILTACALGILIPSLIRAFRMDPKIAAGPIVLACADVATLLFYFGMMNVLADGL